MCVSGGSLGCVQCLTCVYALSNVKAGGLPGFRGFLGSGQVGLEAGVKIMTILLSALAIRTRGVPFHGTRVGRAVGGITS